MQSATSVAYEWHWLIHCIGTACSYMIIQIVLYMLLPPSASYHSSQSPFLPSFLQFSLSFSQWPSFPMHKQLRMSIYSMHTHLLSLCEPLLRRQAWVERPLGSGSRYCRTERWSILDHCSSTEQLGEQNQSALVKMQDILQSAPVYCLDVGPKLSFSSLTCLSAENPISIFHWLTKNVLTPGPEIAHIVF